MRLLEKRALAAALAGTALAMGTWAVLSRPRSTTPPPSPALEWLAGFREESEGHRARMAAYAAEKKWDEAGAEAGALLVIDPLARDAREAQASAAAEARVASTVAEAERLAMAGREEEALARWLEVPRGSSYFGAAALAVRAMARGPLAARLRGDCLGLLRSDRAAAVARCGAYLDLVCSERRDPEIERRLGRGRWSCPPGRADYFQEEKPVAVREREEALRSLWGEGKLAQAVRLHEEEGRTRGAIESLARLSRHDRDGRESALAESLRVVESGLRESQVALLGGKLRQAEAALGAAATADARIVPGFESEPVRAARRELSRAWLDEAGRALGRRQLRAASEALGRGRAADPSGVELSEMSSRLADEVEKRLAAVPSCAELADLAAASPPDSVARRHVEDAATARACNRR